MSRLSANRLVIPRHRVLFFDSVPETTRMIILFLKSRAVFFDKRAKPNHQKKFRMYICFYKIILLRFFLPHGL
jgi:hypothetical protein